MEKIMNREIKFRVWDEKYNQWDTSLLIIHPAESVVKQGRVIQQFTGFLDKKGKEIYEGDIIDTRVSDDCIPDLEKHKYTLIVFFSDNGSWEAKEKMDQFSGSCFPFHSDHYKILLDKTKVIGNIFENPELCAK